MSAEWDGDERRERPFCDAHGGHCIRLDHLEKGLEDMKDAHREDFSKLEGKTNRMWYLMISTLAAVIISGFVGVLNLIVK